MPKHVELANSNSNILENEWTVTCILAISPTGLFGAHHYYLNNDYFGVLYSCTFGIFGIGYIVDWFRFSTLLERYNEDNLKKKYLDDAYLLWFPLGLLGFHHFYLKRPVWGLLYVFTLGFLGVGWLIDVFRMRKLVEKCNEEIDEQAHFPRQHTHTMEMATGKIFCIKINCVEYILLSFICIINTIYLSHSNCTWMIRHCNTYFCFLLFIFSNVFT